MKKLDQIPKTVIYVSVLISLALTPWMNVDSMIIPKVIILFLLAAYIIPKINLLGFLKYRNVYINMVFTVVFLIIMQMILVMTFSDAPVEQQVFGRTGRGLGLITYVSLMIILVAVMVFFNYKNSILIISGICISSFVSSAYSILQFFGLDLINWSTKTNGIIGTLGNPNFQSAFAAMSLPFTLVFIIKNNLKLKFVGILFFSTMIFTLYISESYQGYISVFLSLGVILSSYLWVKSKILFYIFSSSISVSTGVLTLGLFNSGPLSELIYKYSVKSRGEMWRTSIATSSDNPIFGIGLDSFGDYSNYYKSASDAVGVNEYIDNSHNYFLEYAATGGYLLAFLHLLLVLITAFSFLKVQLNLGKFDLNISTLFGAWVAFQGQTLISPANITLLLWNFIISGFIIGIASGVQENFLPDEIQIRTKLTSVRLGSVFLLSVVLIVMFPYFNADRLQQKADRTGDVLLAVQAAKMYPEATMRYQRIGVELLQAGFVEQSVEIGRAAVAFNPNSFYGWAFLLSSDSTEEKNKAVSELKRLDPFNKIIMELNYFE